MRQIRAPRQSACGRDQPREACRSRTGRGFKMRCNGHEQIRRRTDKTPRRDDHQSLRAKIAEHRPEFANARNRRECQRAQTKQPCSRAIEAEHPDQAHQARAADADRNRLRGQQASPLSRNRLPNRNWRRQLSAIGQIEPQMSAPIVQPQVVQSKGHEERRYDGQMPDRALSRSDPEEIEQQNWKIGDHQKRLHVPAHDPEQSHHDPAINAGNAFEANQPGDMRQHTKPAEQQIEIARIDQCPTGRRPPKRNRVALPRTIQQEKVPRRAPCRQTPRARTDGTAPSRSCTMLAADRRSLGTIRMAGCRHRRPASWDIRLDRRGRNRNWCRAPFHVFEPIMP